MEDIFEMIATLWVLFMTGGIVIIFTVMMWQVLREIFTGGW